MASDAIRGGFPNVWLGTSVEDQATADTRIPNLLATPAAVRFVSAEPLLGPVDLRLHRVDGIAVDPLCDECGERHEGRCDDGLDWVIVGGESGPGARPMHPDWPKSLRDQCVAAEVPFFFKQWGEWGDPAEWDGVRRGQLATVMPYGSWRTGEAMHPPRHGNEHIVQRLGKARTGRTLGGREWNGMPG